MALLATLQSWDIQALEWVRNALFIDANWYRGLVLFFSDLQPILMAFFLVTLWLYGVYRRDNTTKYIALDVFWHIFCAFALYFILNQFLPLRPRPESVSSLPALINHLPDNSFPSGHATFFGASWWALVQFTPWRKISLAFFVIGFITCLTRIIAGIHYPGDILAGFLLGWGIVHLLKKLPHGALYHKFANEIPVKIVSVIKL